jgi:hypothetical protein
LAAVALMTLSAVILFVLGALHFVYTFWGPKLTPRDPSVTIRMSEVALVISKQTIMWRCWIGFNASHSMGLMLFGLIYGYLAIAHSQILFHSPFLLVVGLGMAGGICAVSRVYLFSIPFAGTSISLACYVAGIVMSRS